jgi:DNA replication licensing factor MCM2
MRCGYLKGPFFPNERIKIKLGSCHSCHSLAAYTPHNSKSIYRNYQIITIQEAPSLVAAGRIPRSKEAILVGDNIDRVKPGDEVEVTGIFTTRYESILNIKQGFPVFHTFIEVNYIETTQKLTKYLPSTEF